jgi:hypothetical protein
MKTHYTEADLLETYYTQPGESMPVMMHLASCTDCAARYEKLDRKLREVVACDVEKPATFWSRQRLSVMSRIRRPRGVVIRWQAIAATFLAFVLGGAVVYKSVQHPAPPAVTIVAEPIDDEVSLDTPADPWESDELQDFHGVVQWESWVADTKPAKKGETSL